ncbi:MAG: helix-turn-helix domain-containing protein [Tumebacillaceae bacterium]
MTTLGIRLRTLRHQAGMSQNALAQGLVTKSMISQIESDKARPSRQLLAALAERLGVSLDQLLPSQYVDEERLARYKQAQAFFALAHYQDALPLLEECLASPHPNWDLVEVTRQTAHCLHKLRCFEKAQTKYEEALRLAIRMQRSEEEVAIRFVLGQVAYDAGHTQVALQEWMRTYQELKNFAAAAMVQLHPVALEDLCLQLGTVYEELHGWEEAICFYKEARRALQGKRAASRKRAAAERGLGAMFVKVRRFHEAETHLRDAADLYKMLKDFTRLYEVDVLQAALFRETGRYQEALQVLKTALTEVEALQLPEQQALLLFEQGRILRKMGKRVTALERLQEATLRVPNGNGIHGGIHLEMAELHCDEGWWQSALREAECAKCLLASDAKQEEDLLRVYRLLTHLYKQIGDYERASQALAETHMLLDKQMREKGWMLASAVQAL